MSKDSLEGPRPELARPETAETARSSASAGAASAGAAAASSARRGTAAPMPPFSAQQGTYYTPPPSTVPQAPAGRSRWGIAALCAVVAVGVSVGGWLAFRGDSGPPPPAAAAVEADRSFSVASADLDAKATEQLKAQLAGGATAEGLKAVNAPALTALEKDSEMAEDIREGKRVLYRVYLLDYLAQDGDQVELSVDGVGLGPVYLSNMGTSIVLPLAKGQPAQIKLAATADGGGGVTVGFVSSLGEARTSVLQVGQSEQWQVTVQ